MAYALLLLSFILLYLRNLKPEDAKIFAHGFFKLFCIFRFTVRFVVHSELRFGYVAEFHSSYDSLSILYRTSFFKLTAFVLY